MTNVLPIPAQKSLWAMHRARFLIILSLVMIGLAVLAYVALIPSFVALEANSLTEEELSAQSSTAAESLKAMTKSQALLTAVLPVIAATSSPVRAMEKALSLKPKGAVVNRIRYVGTSKTIQLGGTANRDVLTAYRTALEADGTFKTVSVPVAALVGASGQFSITLGGTF
jgi:hypothetical protein